MQKGILLNNTYRLLKTLGMGGLGEIYLGYHENLQKYVVIKKVKDHCTGLVNNRIEVDILKSLHHTYLPQVYDFIENEEGIFTVMEYISGHDLKYYADTGCPYEEEQLIVWMKQLCEVLDYLHTRRPAIIHCDIKPGNIMITEDANICLIDFNISLDGENNKDLVGLSSAYASPEQVKKAEYKMHYGSGDAVKMDTRTDIYSVGAVFYYLMSGIRPDVNDEQRLRLTEMELPYSSALCNIVEKAMEREPVRRFRTAAKMLDALEHQERWASWALKLWKMSILLDSAVAGISLILLCVLIISFRGMRKEQFFEAYSTYMIEAKECLEDWEYADDSENLDDIYESVLSKGILLLGKNEYQKQFSENPEMMAEVLSVMGQASLQCGEYESASEYLEEAAEYKPEDIGIYRNLTIALAKNGAIRKAEKTLEQALETGLDEEDGFLLMAEISLAKEEYQDAWVYATEAAKSQNEAVVERATYYLLETVEKTGEYEECLQFIKNMKNRKTGISGYIWLRKQGELCFLLYEHGKSEYLTQAVACYEEVYQSGYAQLSDLYNLEYCYMEQGKLRTAESLLLKMQKQFPDEYQIVMRLAYNVYRQQNEKSPEERDYTYMLKYFEAACDICEEKEIDWNNDTNMLQLQLLTTQLKEQGWLED